MLTREEAIRIIKILKAQYPEHYANVVTVRQSEDVIKRFMHELRNHDFEIVKETVYAWIANNPKVHPHLSELCKACYRNPKYLDRIFQKMKAAKETATITNYETRKD